MTPRLYSIAGPMKGTSIPLVEESVTIGRDRSNQVHIADLHLSRRHCQIKKDGSNYVLLDLGSRNGVFVNSIPVRERTLTSGDRIEAGASMFVFYTEDEESPAEQIEAVSTMTGSSLTTRWDEDRASIRDSKDLDLLLKISSAIGPIQNVESLSRKLLDLIAEAIPAERASILLLDPHSGGLIMVARTTKSPDLPLLRIDRTLADRVVREKSALLANDVLQEELSIPSLLCAPLVVLNHVLGILYADTLLAATHFTEKHLQLLNAVANISAPVIKNSLDLEKWVERNKRLQMELQMERQIVGEGPAMKKVLELIKKVSIANTTVLISGESGTGKELAARAIHTNSPRADAPFIAINCAALPEPLMESELFGYEKGAFTGALAQKKGKIEAAAGGTLFLDEVAELSPALQAKLLRFLQEREFERVGGTRPIKVDLRLLAATNKDLKKEVENQKFRLDLFYRLNVVQVEMPPLRDLGDDLLLMANYFVSRLSTRIGRRVHGISSEAQECLMQYDWPGNARELENVLERAVLLGGSDVILAEDLPEPLLAFKPPAEKAITDFHQAINEYKKTLIRKALKDTNQNYKEAAANLGIHTVHLYRLVRTLMADEK